MKKVGEWVRNNKLATFLIILVVFLLFRNSLFSLKNQVGYQTSTINNMGSLPVTGGGTTPTMDYVSSSRNVSPTTSKERLVIESSNISLVVDDVEDISSKVIAKTKELGGFMVGTSLTKPQESPFGTVIVRVPEDKTDEALNYFRSLAVKVISEQVLGQDVTDRYEDIDAKLATLTKTKAKFEEILEKATSVNDILSVQKQLVNLQSQIDNLKGRQKYLEKSAALTKITVFLSSDELALPYQPEGVFRPKVIFKQAVRSLIKTLRSFASLIIWVVVYAPLWGGILIIILLAKRYGKRKRTNFIKQ